MSWTRRDFLKAIGVTLAAFGTPTAASQLLFNQGSEKVLLRDAVKALKDDPNGFITLMAETYALTQPDLKLLSGSVNYWVRLGGNIGPLCIRASERKNELGVREFLRALKQALISGKKEEFEVDCPYTKTWSTLCFHGSVIASVWSDVPLVEFIDAESGPKGEMLVAGYSRKYGNINEIIGLAQKN